LLMRLRSLVDHNPFRLGCSRRGCLKVFSYYRDTLEVTNNNRRKVEVIRVEERADLCGVVGVSK
jgi:hypothetical protein